jgi:hypothetical protein
MRVLREITKVTFPLLRSMFTFPSCVFWICTTFPVFGYLFSYLINVIHSNFEYGYVLTVSMLLILPYSEVILFSRLGKIVAFIRLVFIIHRYYSRVLKSAAASARTLISSYLKRIVLLSGFLVVSECCFLFINQDLYPVAHYLSLLAYFICSIFFNITLVYLNRIKKGEMFPFGYIIDTAIIVLTIVGFPFHMWQLKQRNYMSFTYNLSAIAIQVIHLLIDIKFIFIGLVVLRYKFVRLKSQSLP